MLQGDAEVAAHVTVLYNGTSSAVLWGDGGGGVWVKKSLFSLSRKRVAVLTLRKCEIEISTNKSVYY